jgi:hypothetical protein
MKAASRTFTLLDNGQVLVAGGQNAGGRLGSAELYDPVAKTWSGTGAFTPARVWHTATLLGTGKVLVAGGANIVNSSSVYFTRAELYDPGLSTWSGTGALATSRCWHTSTLLGTG